MLIPGKLYYNVLSVNMYLYGHDGHNMTSKRFKNNSIFMCLECHVREAIEVCECKFLYDKHIYIGNFYTYSINEYFRLLPDDFEGFENMA